MTFNPRKSGLPVDPTRVWPKWQMRVPPEMRELTDLYAALVGLKPTAIARTVLRHHLSSVFGKGRTAADVRAQLEAMSPNQRQEFVIRVRSAFEGVTAAGVAQIPQ